MGGGRFSLFESRRIRRAQMTQRHRSMSEGWHLILMWVLLFCLPSLARGGWTEGLEAFDLGNYATAYREFLPLALQGDAKAQFGIGAMYYDGLDRPQDHVQAVKWFSLAAAQGLAVAQYLLGTQYRKGQGVPQDYAQALIWFHLAAVQGEANAQYELGDMHFDGQGIPQDYVQAVMWFRKAADQGQSHAQVMLDSMYEIGHGVPQDYVQAATWSRKAAEQGEAIAYLALGLMYTAGRGVPLRFYPGPCMAQSRSCTAAVRGASEWGCKDPREHCGADVPCTDCRSPAAGARVAAKTAQTASNQSRI
jgi:hypothetical protein